MKDEIERLLYALISAWRYRWQGLLCAWLVFIAGWLVVSLIPDRFESRALVYVDTTSLLKPLLQGIAVPSNQASEADIVRRTLLARPTLVRVARETGLAGESLDDEQFDRLLMRLAGDIKILGNRDSEIYSISYVNRDPRRAQAVVQHLLSTFVTSSRNAGQDDSETARKFLAQQVHDYEVRLAASEQKLAEFKKKNISLLPGTQGDYFQRLQGEMIREAQLETELDVATKQRDELRRKMAGQTDDNVKPPPLPSPQELSGAAALDATIQSSERQLEDLLQKDTDKHPDVIALKATIDRLKQRRAREFGSIRTSIVTQAPASTQQGVAHGDDVLENIQIQLTNKDVQIAALKAQVDEAKQSVASLQGLLSTGPEVEAQYTGLMRDYGVTKAEYEQLLQRLESARISDKANATDGVNYRVIEPPRLPVRPIAPKRPMFLGLVLLVSLGCGAALAWLLSQAKPVYMDARALQGSLGLPVVGVISLAPLASSVGAAYRGRLLYSLGIVLLLTGGIISIMTSHSASVLLRTFLRMGVA
jgi:polysaccharide chain length determinant protein (PEP-CTERM system associated)